MNKVKVAVIGAGYWGKNIVRNVESNSMTELVALCDSNKLSAKKLLSNQGIDVPVYDSVDSLLTGADVDAVSIVTPVHTHFQIAMKSLCAGKHVLIEKPMAMKYSEAAEIVKVSNSKKLNVMCDHTFCYSSPVIEIKKIIQSGEIGQLLQVNSSRCNLGLLQPDVNVLWDLAPHDISIVNHVTAYHEIPKSVNAYGKTIAGYNHEVDAMLSIDYRSGLHVNIHNSWLFPVKTRKMSFVGTKKMIMWDDLLPDDQKVTVFDKGVNVVNHRKFEYYDNNQEAVRLQKSEPLAAMITEFAASIIEERKPESSCEEGLQTIRLLEAATGSITNSRKICLE